MGDRALHHKAELQQTVEEQHRLYLELMPQAGRPKLHYLLHTASCMEAQGANFSCFPGERLLSIPKNLGKDCYREFAQSLTRRVLKNLMDNFADETAYEENIVIKPKWASDLIGLICLGTVVAGLERHWCYYAPGELQTKRHCLLERQRSTARACTILLRCAITWNPETRGSKC